MRAGTATGGETVRSVVVFVLAALFLSGASPAASDSIRAVTAGRGGGCSELQGRDQTAPAAPPSKPERFLTAYIGNNFNRRDAAEIAAAICAGTVYPDPLLHAAHLEIESSFEPLSKGALGEIGLAQFMPSWVGTWGRRAGLDIPSDPWDIEQNIRFGEAIFGRSYTDDYRRALFAYDHSWAYVDKVEAKYRELVWRFRLWEIREGK